MPFIFRSLQYTGTVEICMCCLLHVASYKQSVANHVIFEATKIYAVVGDSFQNVLETMQVSCMRLYSLRDRIIFFFSSSFMCKCGTWNCYE
jgi:hypothetical protein